MAEEQVQRIPLQVISPHPLNDRELSAEDPQDQELAQQIRTDGVMQPIVVAPLPIEGMDVPGEYVIVFGHRRWFCSGLAGQQTVPAIVRPYSSDRLVELFEHQVLENLARKDLTPMAEARKVARLLAPVEAGGFGLSQRQAAARLKKPQPWVARRSALNRLPALVQEQVDSGRIASYSAYILARLADHPDQLYGVIEETRGLDEHGVRAAVDRALGELGVEADHSKGGRRRNEPALIPEPETPPTPVRETPPPTPVREAPSEQAAAEPQQPRPRRPTVPLHERERVAAGVELPGRVYAWAMNRYGRFNMRRVLSAIARDELERQMAAEGESDPDRITPEREPDAALAGQV